MWVDLQPVYKTRARGGELWMSGSAASRSGAILQHAYAKVLEDEEKQFHNFSSMQIMVFLLTCIIFSR